MSQTIENMKTDLLAKVEASSQPREVLKDPALKELIASISSQPETERAAFGASLNQLKKDLQAAVAKREEQLEDPVVSAPLDVTAPWDVNASQPQLLPAQNGSVHPLMSELEGMLDIYARMGFASTESRQLDDEWHMFTSLNFPADHPARDDYDTFMTEEGLVAPAHTSTMQNRVMAANKHLLEEGQPIAFIITGRVFRNEDVDARHEHTFHQLEAVYVDKGVHTGMLIATLRAFFQEYYRKDVRIKTQPFYFPFTEPSLEFAASCIFCDSKGCNICSQTGWIELGGCGMIHPNVLDMAGIDPKIYTAFAWGFGLERMVMIKYGIEDVRHFHSGKLDFLRQF